MWNFVTKKHLDTWSNLCCISRCGNPNNIYVWAEQQQFHDLNLPQDKKFVKNVVYGSKK